MFSNIRRYALTAVLVLFGIGSLAAVAQATHSWGGYHWARTANPFTLQLGKNVSSAWSPYLAAASTDWSLSDVLDTVVVPTKSNKSCRATSGRVEVCNKRYGANGWLGIAQIWVSGGHIVQGTVKLNDTYFGTAKYNTPAWKQSVMCQEIGHTFGLAHQDENFTNANLGTCMDYTNDPSTNQHPNQHDYDELAIIYAHLDSTNTVFASYGGSGGTNNKGKPTNVGQDIDLDNPSAWGKAVRQDARGKNSLYVRNVGDEKIFTFVIWTD